MAVTMNRFHWADYVVTVGMLLISLGIGFFFAVFRGGQKTKVEYLLGSRQMSMLPVCLSLFVTFQSAISLIGTPADTYNTGTMTMFINFGLGFAYVVGYFTVVPVMYPLHLISVYEYLGVRFKSKAVRLFATCVGMLQTMLYMGISLFAPALALQAAAGLPLWVSVATVGGVGTLYTAVGGIKSVVWTDAVQTLIVFFGIATILIKGIIDVGGFGKLFEIASEGGRLDFDEISPDPRVRHTYWGALIGACIMWQVNCFSQSSVQRIGAMQTLKDAKRAFLLNLPLQILYGTTLALTGIVLYAYVITVRCDPYHAGLISNKNQMMPYFVIQVLSNLPGMAGIYMSMLFSGALSTVSSGINALAANTVEDLLARPLRGVKDTTVTIVAKIAVVIYGCLAIGLAYLMKSLQGPVTQMGATAFGAVGGPMVGMFLLGGAFPWGNKYGAICGGVVGLVVNLWIAVGSRLYGQPIVSLAPGPTDNCFNISDSANTFLNYPHLTSDLPGSVLNVTSWTAGVVGDSMDFTMTGVETTTLGLAGNESSGSHVTDDRPFSVYDISYLWIGAIGLLSSFLSGIIISFITGHTDPESVDPKLIFPFCRKLYRMPDPVYSPEDTSHYIAMKNYREAWEKFKKRSVQVEVPEDGNGYPVQTGRAKRSGHKKLSF
nr:hypothetical protein BaRGS_018411 [Batillaria attramentaria]